MEKKEFLEVAPRYYALAVVNRFERDFSTTTRSQIVEDFSIRGDSSDPEERIALLGNSKLLDKALDILQEERLIEVEPDHFGPPLVIPKDEFSHNWDSLVIANAIYSRYNRVNYTEKLQWLHTALLNLLKEEVRLHIQYSDFEPSNDEEWRPIPVEHSPETEALITAIDDATEKIRTDNGYSATRPEEVKFVVDSLKTFNTRLKEYATLSLPYIRQYAIDPLWKAAKVLGRNVAGIAVEAAKARLKDWLMKAGIPWPFDWL